MLSLFFAGMGCLLAGLSLLVLIFCVISTQSRGGTLALGFVAFHYWLKSPKKMVTGAVAGPFDGAPSYFTV